MSTATKKAKTDGKPARGVKSLDQIKAELGPHGLEQVSQAQKQFPKAVLYAAARMFPSLPKKIETWLANVPESEASQCRATLLKAFKAK